MVIFALLVLVLAAQGSKKIVMPGIFEVEQGPESGVWMEDSESFLLANSIIVIQRVYLSLNPAHSIAWYRKENPDSFGDVLEEDLLNHITISQSSTRNSLKRLEDTLKKVEFDGDEFQVLANLETFFGFAFHDFLTLTFCSQPELNILSILKSNIEVLRKNRESIRNQLSKQQTELESLGSAPDKTVVLVTLPTGFLSNHRHHSLVNDNTLFVEEPYRLMYYMGAELLLTLLELENAKVPSYLVPRKALHEILKQSLPEGKPIHRLQLAVAQSMGFAFPIHVDVQKMEVGFLLLLPYADVKDIYRLKSVSSVGYWLGDIYVKFNTPPVLAYQDGIHKYWVPDPSPYQMLRGNSYLCCSWPCLQDANTHLCGLESDWHPEQCRLFLRKDNEGDQTHVVKANSQWIVSVQKANVTLIYLRGSRSVEFPLPYRINLIKVLEGALLHIGGNVLYPLDSDDPDITAESVDTFRGYQPEVEQVFGTILKNKKSAVVHLQLDDYEAEVIFRDSPQSVHGPLYWPPVLALFVTCMLLWLVGKLLKIVRPQLEPDGNVIVALLQGGMNVLRRAGRTIIQRLF